MTRPHSQSLDAILFQKFPLLDNGWLQVTDYMGNEESIVNAARQSYGSGTSKRHNDAGLINYLMRHQHMSPFEMCSIAVQVHLPIFVMRQWIRHRASQIASANEISGRYSVLEDEFYIPDLERMCTQSSTNHQGSGEPLPIEVAAGRRATMQMLCSDIHGEYVHSLEVGLARELGRIILPQNLYTTMTWKCNARDLMHFLHLRTEAHAQYEIQVYALVLEDIASKWLPNVTAAYIDYVRDSVRLSSKQAHILKGIVGNNAPHWEEAAATFSGMSKGEQVETKQLFSSLGLAELLERKISA